MQTVKESLLNLFVIADIQLIKVSYFFTVFWSKNIIFIPSGPFHLSFTVLPSNSEKCIFFKSTVVQCLSQSGCVCLCVSILTCKRPGSPRRTSIGAYTLQEWKCETSTPVSSAWGKTKDAGGGQTTRVRHQTLQEEGTTEAFNTVRTGLSKTLIRRPKGSQPDTRPIQRLGEVFIFNGGAGRYQINAASELSCKAKEGEKERKKLTSIRRESESTSGNHTRGF